MTISGQSSQPLLSVELAPITDGDLSAVATFLGAHFPPDTLAAEWAEAWRTSVNLPGAEAPNNGFLLRAGGSVVGAYPAIYSTRVISGRRERFCNLAVWCMAPEYRAHSVRLLRAILDQDGYHFTDLTPIVKVQELNLRLGFRYLETRTAVVPHLPVPLIGRRVRVSEDPRVIEASLEEPVLGYYRDHANCRWAKHLVLTRDDRACYVVWRMERHKGLSVFASIRYASDPVLLRQSFAAVGRHLLVHHGALASLVELRISDGRVRPSWLLRQQNRRMYRSATLGPGQIDYLYSEITSAP